MSTLTHSMELMEDTDGTAVVVGLEAILGTATDKTLLSSGSFDC